MVVVHNKMCYNATLKLNQLQMKVEVFDSSIERVVGMMLIKFILSVRDNVTTLTISEVKSGREHIDLLPNNSELIGGGDIIRKSLEDENDKTDEESYKYVAKWGSYSCKRDKGYDRPDKEERKTILTEEIRQAFLDWQRSIR